jgi:hypothetical protein
MSRYTPFILSFEGRLLSVISSLTRLFLRIAKMQTFAGERLEKIGNVGMSHGLELLTCGW